MTRRGTRRDGHLSVSGPAVHTESENHVRTTPPHG